MQDRLTELDRLVNRLDSEWKTQRSKSYVQHLIPKHLLSAPIPNRTGSQGNAAEYAADALTQVMASVLIRAFIKFPEPKDGLKDDRHGNSRGTSLNPQCKEHILALARENVLSECRNKTSVFSALNEDNPPEGAKRLSRPPVHGPLFHLELMYLFIYNLVAGFYEESFSIGEDWAVVANLFTAENSKKELHQAGVDLISPVFPARPVAFTKADIEAMKDIIDSQNFSDAGLEGYGESLMEDVFAWTDVLMRVMQFASQPANKFGGEQKIVKMAHVNLSQILSKKDSKKAERFIKERIGLLKL